MNRLGLGACLADDMGLGKTMQVLSLLLVLKRRREQLCVLRRSDAGRACSSFLPRSSPIGRLKSRFAPSLSVFYAHPSETPTKNSADRATDPARRPWRRTDLVITSYSMAMRLAWLKEVNWNLVILDEAQAIKNPGARQSRAVKELRCRHRIALSGTPDREPAFGFVVAL